ncbi:MAG TPA: HAD-IA family hydrolase [Baekduia sp.]|uniref:HAD family hydrolase n=1 Tax=Baekduia sp. TaxID=2600305 RepID=UPI002D79DD96|nr:HAD-IA family hydrolase [Baekduia sp.]HET6508744.1 HAD-IA family hydrolase [Baekduia sp.]
MSADDSPRGLASGRELAQGLARAAAGDTRRPRAVFLDALGTLLALEPPAPRLVAALARRGVTVSEQVAAGALREEIAYYRAHHHEARDVAALADLRDRCAAVLQRHLPEPVPDLRAALLASLRFTPYPEVPDALRALRAGGVRLVVVSNWDVSLHEALAATGLARLVDGAISSAEVGAAKPDPAIFARALALAGDGVTPGDAVHVGDEAVDVEGARAAGVAPVLVGRDGAERAPARRDGVPVLPDLRGLPALILS